MQSFICAKIEQRRKFANALNSKTRTGIITPGGSMSLSVVYTRAALG
jgi:hypothetical protein